ncbi:MAG TPA: hypothetical protein VF712_19795, partial [Thermoleophilaceae bacterium]
MRKGIFGPPSDEPAAPGHFGPPPRGRGGGDGARRQRRFDTDQLLRELPSVDPELRGLFQKWSSAKERSRDATGAGGEEPAAAAAGAPTRKAADAAPREQRASLRERARSAPPVRKPPPPRSAAKPSRPAPPDPKLANGAPPATERPANGSARAAGGAPVTPAAPRTNGR